MQANVPAQMIPIALFVCGAAVMIFGPLARAVARRMERGADSARVPADLDERLARIEQSIESIAIEIERVSEGQRFTTKLLSEQGPARQLKGGEARDL